jgi:hypothetical protein
VEPGRGAVCIFSAFMRFLGALGGALSILSGDRFGVFEFGSPNSEFFNAPGTRSSPQSPAPRGSSVAR